MKIGLVCTHFPPKQNAGSIRMRTFAEAWSRHACHEVYVFTENHKQAPKYKPPKGVIVYRSLIQTASNKKGVLVRTFTELLLSLSVFIKLLVHSKLDVIVVSSPPFLLAVAISRVARIRRIPYVADIRDTFPEALFDSQTISRSSFLGRLLLRMEQTVYNKSSFVSTVTPGFAKHIQAKSHTSIIQISNGVETNRFTPSEVGIHLRPFTLAFVGILARFQNIKLLVSYAELLKKNTIDDIKILVMGDGPKQEYLEKSIENLNLDDYIDYRGHTAYEDVIYLLGQSDLGISPRIEGELSRTCFPVKIYEYMAAGLPILVTPRCDAGS